MNSFKVFIFSLIVLITSCKLYAQVFTFNATPDEIEVIKNGIALQHPWAGGVNSAQFFNLDLDQDGIQDVVMFDRSGNKVTAFLVRGSGESVEYEYTEDYQSNFPPLRDWVVAYDFDCDGYTDLFTYMPGGIRVYRNTTEDTGEIGFQQITPSNTPSGSPLHSLYTNNYVNLYVSSVNIPALVDVDNDGDMDILTFGSWGTTLHYHRNMSMEKYGHCDSLDFELRNRCWGYFSESFTSNELALFDTCDFNVSNPEFDLDDNGEWIVGQGGNRHEGATLCPLDAYENGLTDLLIADIEYSTISLLKNGGTPSHASIVDQDNTFPSYDIPLDLDEFPAAFYLDIDNDGVKDLLASPNQTISAENSQSVWMYKNKGATNLPDFEFKTKAFLQEEMIDVGEGAIPMFVDINQNGKMDIIISNFRYYNENTLNDQRFMLLLNEGTAEEPKFKIEDDNFLNMSQYGLGNHLTPTFEDLNGDGKPDMILGDLQGRLHYFQNISSGNTISFSPEQSPMTDAQGNIIDVGNFAAPHLVDLNRNDKKDLIIGCRNGNVWYYENSGSSSSFNFSFVTDSLGKISTALPSRPNNGHSSPIVKEIDGEYRMLVGSLHGDLYQYRNIDGNLNGTFQLITNATIPFMGNRIFPTMAQLQGGEEHTLLVGNLRGGVSAFTQEFLEADFSASTSTLCAGDTVTFTDQSSGNPIAWNWEFTGASPSTSSEQHPSVIYENEGSFSVTLTVTYQDDELSNTKENYILVHELPNVAISENEMTCASLCDGGLVVQASGNGPFSYSWEHLSSSTTSPALTNLCEGEYIVSVKDANECITIVEYELTAPPIDLFYDLATDEADCGESNGCVTISNLSGGTLEPLSVSWSDGANDLERCGFYAGIHDFLIVDGNNCEFTQHFEITNPNAPQVELVLTKISCEGDCDGEVEVVVTGGVPPYDYQWEDASLPNLPVLSNLCEQFLKVIVVDSDLCQSSMKSDSLSYENKYPIVYFEASDTLVQLEENPVVSFFNFTEFATNYEWNFDDDETSTQFEPTHEFTSSGEFLVTLTAWNGTCQREFSRIIIVESTNQVDDYELFELNYFPNPVNDILTIEWNGTNTVHAIRLFSSEGKEVKMQSVSQENKTVLNVENLSSGMYFMHLELNSGYGILRKVVIH